MSPPNRSRNRRWTFIIGGFLAVVALAGLGLTVAVLVGRSKVEAKLVSLGERFGLRIEVSAVDIPIVGAIGARGLKAYGQSGALVAEIAHIETDISLIDAALGASRPGRVTLRGGHVHLRIVDGRPIDFALAAPSGEAASGLSDAISLALADVVVSVEATQSTSKGAVTIVPLELTLEQVEVARDAERQLQAGVRGVWRTASGQTAFTAELDTRAGRVAAHLDTPLALGVDSPWGPVWLTLGGFERQRGGVTLVSGIDVVRGDDRLTVGRVTLGGGGDGWAPDPAALTQVTLEDLVARHDGRSLSAAEATIAFVAEPGFPWPSPGAVTLTHMHGEAPEPTTGGTLRGDADEVALGLATPQAKLAAGQPLDALSAVKLVRPKVTLVLPRQSDDSVAPAEPSDSAEAGDAPDPDGPLVAMLGNDDDLPTAAPTSEAPRKSFAFLDKLFGEGDRHDPTLADFLPAAMGQRVEGLIAKLRVLRPEVRDASIEVVDRAGKSLVALEGASLSVGEAEGGLLSIALRAAVLRDGKETGRADLTIATNERGVIEWVEGELAGKDVANRLARFVPHLTVQPDAELALDIRYARPKSDDAPHHVAGTISVRNFTFQFWRISDREVRDLQGAATFDLSVDRKGRRLLLNLPELAMGDARLFGSLDLSKSIGKLPSFTARLSMARQDCGKAIASIPKALIPNLSTLAMKGEMQFDASLVVDLEKPMDLDLDVTGKITDCKVLSLGPGIDLQALKGPFVHHPREPNRGVLEHISVGPGTSQWVKSEKLPDIVKLAAWVTEDRAWTKHAGVRWDLVARALKIDLTHGRFIYGGSTVTQQLVKNLYLTRTKNLARKLEEAIIAMQMERVLTKDEILTIYINCIEYGPDIYGVKHAARQYFDKKVDELDALEAAFIMGLKPFPKSGYNQWLKGRLDEYWIKRISHIMRMLPKFGPEIITAEEAEAFAPFQPTFAAP